MGTNTARAGRPRGRPQRLPVDSSTARSSRTDGNKRLAWLLAVSRIYAAPTEAHNRTVFAERLRELDVRADSSRISRWESGMEALPAKLVRSYEKALALPAHSLDVVRRHLARTGDLTTRAGQRGEETLEHPDLNRILIGLDGGQMDGATWLDLTDGLASYERIFLPDSTWRSLTDRLAAELTRSSGLAYARRFEAGAALMNNVTARPHINRSVGRFTLSPGAQLVAPTLTLLGEQPDRGVHDLVLRMLTSENDRMRGAAEVTATRLVETGAIRADAHELEVHVGYSVHNATEDRPGAAVTELAARMPGECFERIVAAARSRRLRQWLHQVRDHCESVDADQARAVSDRVSAASEATCQGGAREPDPMLRSLVREALFHAFRARRWEATLLLAASPYATGVATAALAETAHADPAIAGPCWSMLSRMALSLDSSVMLRAVTAERRPPLRHRALGCLASLRSPLEPGSIDELVRAAADPGAGAAGRAALMVLGLGGHLPGRHLGDHHPPEVLDWWSRLGGSIHDPH